MSIYAIKLSTTEEVLAQRVSEDENAVHVSRPLVYNMNPQTQQLILVPWLLSIGIGDTATIPIYKHAITSRVPVHQELAAHYHRIIEGMLNPAPPTSAQQSQK